MSGNPGDLVTQAQALAWLGQTSDPSGIIAALISSVSTQIQNFIGYQIASANYTRTFNGTGGKKLLLPDRPVTAVASLTIDTISIPAASPPSWGYLFDTKFLYLYEHHGHWGLSPGFVSGFTRGVQNVVVSYTAGYAAVPYDLQQACLNWLGSAYALLGQDPSVVMLRAGDTQIDFGNVLTKLDGSVQVIPPAVLAMILPYRRVAT
ncbi:MAG TPA: hypothetical protein VEF90_16525 [Xanthobacteraceae bacterium]|nr:hypothetical protein [Xanthobacteraceae bacterium]